MFKQSIASRPTPLSDSLLPVALRHATHFLAPYLALIRTLNLYWLETFRALIFLSLCNQCDCRHYTATSFHSLSFFSCSGPRSYVVPQSI